MIEIAVDSGSNLAGVTVEPIAIALNRALAKSTDTAYSPAVESYQVAWRVSGDIADFQFEGLDKLRRYKKDRAMTVDLGVPQSRWKGVPRPELRRYLIEQTRRALQAFVDRLKKDREPIDEARLFEDYDRAAEAVQGISEPLSP